MVTSFRLPTEALRRSWRSTLGRLVIFVAVSAVLFWFVLGLLGLALTHWDLTARAIATAAATGLLAVQLGRRLRIAVRQYAEHYTLVVGDGALLRSLPPLPDSTLREAEIVRVAEHPRWGQMLRAADGRSLRLPNGLPALEQLSASLAALPRNGWDATDRRALVRERRELQRALKKEGRFRAPAGQRVVVIAVWVGLFLFFFDRFRRADELRVVHGSTVEQTWRDATERTGP